MKELSVEEKAKHYDEALVWMRDLYPSMIGAMKEDAEHYFPELKESEDERIRKAIYTYLKNELTNTVQLTPRTNEFEDWLFWLEKATRNMTENKVELKFKVGDIIRHNSKQWEIIGIDYENHCYDLTDEECVDFDTADDFEFVDKKASWSEGDENAIGMAIIALNDLYDEDSPDTTYGGYNLPFNKAAERLKSLKERYTWKPSDEQMQQLCWIAEQNKDNMIGKELMSLYQDLKTLKRH